jgi:hypothetical protein
MECSAAAKIHLVTHYRCTLSLFFLGGRGEEGRTLFLPLMPLRTFANKKPCKKDTTYFSQ